MRRREAQRFSRQGPGLHGTAAVRGYHTWIGNPLIFTSVSGFLVLRAILTDPLQGLAIISVGASGVLAFHLRFGLRGLFGTASGDL